MQLVIINMVICNDIPSTSPLKLSQTHRIQHHSHFYQWLRGDCALQPQMEVFLFLTTIQHQLILKMDSFWSFTATKAPSPTQ